MLLKKKKPEKEKIVVLNSGGFDSVVLMNCLSLTQPDVEIHSLHFVYGAINEPYQRKCVDNICKKVGAKSEIITLPPFTWTKGEFYVGGTYDINTQYVEYRNLVFLSYALSYAEAIGAKKIYLAILANGSYSDTNTVFLESMNNFSTKNSGIEIVTPFDQLTKDDLLTYAIQAKMTSDDFFSCDIPNPDGTPCGHCVDCLSLEAINEALKVDHPMKALYRSGFDFTDKTFKGLLKSQPIEEVRALINNSCQLKCSHCFYGFTDMKAPALSKEEYYKVLKELVLEYGVKNIHFSGKEPLFDADILWYADRIKKDKLPCTFNVVTNGINIPKYAKQLKNLGIERVCLSVDDVLNTNGVRSVHGVTDKAIKACADAKIPVEIFIDLHENNWNKLPDIINYLAGTYKVKQFHIRTIRSLGNAENQTLLTGEQLDIAWCSLKETAKQFKKVNFQFSVSIEYAGAIDNSQTLRDDIDSCEDLYTDYYSDNLQVRFEEYCSRYAGTITLTPDGYLLGCASEVSLPNYDEVSVGNVREEPLKTLIERGRGVAEHTNDFLDGKCDGMCCACDKSCRSLLI